MSVVSRGEELNMDLFVNTLPCPITTPRSAADTDQHSILAVCARCQDLSDLLRYFVVCDVSRGCWACYALIFYKGVFQLRDSAQILSLGTIVLHTRLLDEVNLNLVLENFLLYESIVMCEMIIKDTSRLRG